MGEVRGRVVHELGHALEGFWFAGWSCSSERVGFTPAKLADDDDPSLRARRLKRDVAKKVAEAA